MPTRQEMAEIEELARLYEEQGALVMTAIVINGVAEGRPSRAQVTFVLTKTHLVSVRYADPLPFRTFETKCQRQSEALTRSDRILVSLLESIVERAADVLEMVAADLNEVSTRLFIEDWEPGRRKAKRVENQLQVLIKRLGRKNMIVSILRESLLSLSRLTPYVRQGAAGVDHQRHSCSSEAARPGSTLAGHLRSATVLGNRLPARSNAGVDQPRSEPHHQGVLHRRSVVLATHAGRHDLRHELRPDAGTQVGVTAIRSRSP